MKIKRYHEAPKSVFREVQQMTDGDYALVHLFESDKEYYKLFEDALNEGRDVILDNSLFELREQFDPDRFAYWVKKLRPTWYIVPDVWKDSNATIASFKEFVMQYPDLPGKRIGVAQGLGLKDTIECYKAIEPYCDMVAFNLQGEQWFDKAVYPNMAGVEELGSLSYITAMSVGRFNLISSMHDLGVINEDKPHHLLGVGLAYEAQFYVDRDTRFIRSIDTSSPVACAMSGQMYDEFIGNKEKPALRMCDHMDDDASEQLEVISYNIDIFNEFCGG